MKGTIESLSPGDCVVAIQSDAFRLDGYRFRIFQFEKKLKVIVSALKNNQQGGGRGKREEKEKKEFPI